jgi:hypothetical protein
MQGLVVVIAKRNLPLRRVPAVKLFLTLRREVRHDDEVRFARWAAFLFAPHSFRAGQR